MYIYIYALHLSHLLTKSRSHLTGFSKPRFKHPLISRRFHWQSSEGTMTRFFFFVISLELLPYFRYDAGQVQTLKPLIFLDTWNKESDDLLEQAVSHSRKGQQLVYSPPFYRQSEGSVKSTQTSQKSNVSPGIPVHNWPIKPMKLPQNHSLSMIQWSIKVLHLLFSVFLHLAVWYRCTCASMASLAHRQLLTLRCTESLWKPTTASRPGAGKL